MPYEVADNQFRPFFANTGPSRCACLPSEHKMWGVKVPYPVNGYFSFNSGQRSPVMPGVAIKWDGFAENTFTVANLPEDDSKSVLLHVKWSVIGRGQGDGEDDGTLTGKLRGSVGDPPGGERKKAR